MAAAASSSGAQIWASSDSGVTWSLTGAPTGSFQNYTAMAASTDGTKLAATGASFPTRYIYTSTDSGTSWNPTSAPNYPFQSIASSANGSRLVSAAYNYNAIATSLDSGANWDIHTVPSNWFAVASSADGSMLAAAALSAGGFLTSTNGGLTWLSNNAPKVSFCCLASSADGRTLFAGHGAGLYSTTDAGQSWVSNNVQSYLWRTIACTPDAKRGIAAVASGPSTSFIFLSTAPPSLIISATRTNTTLSWPTNSSGFQLQQTVAIGTPNWKDVTNAIVITNTQNTVTVLKSNSQAFFRLRGL